MPILFRHLALLCAVLRTLSSALIGGGWGGVFPYFTGTIDEVRVSEGARSADWILAEYRNQSSPATFYTVGAESALQTAAPTFTPAPGTYTSPINVTLSSATTGASIRYTLDGSTPTSSTGTIYSAPVAVGATAAIKAIAYKSGSADSAVTSAAYTITGTVATPTVTPAPGTYTSAQTVAISTSTPGASIRYTTNGSTPTSASGTVYSGAFTVPATATVKAIAYLAGWTDSAVASSAYTITGTVATPTFSPAAGGYTSTQSVTISTATPGASIRYTTDGSAPTSSTGILYSAPVPVNATTTLKAIAYEAGWLDSAVAAAAYTLTVSVPSISPAAGTYTSAQTVSISAPGASIRYTTDGSTPTATTGTVYTVPFQVGATATVKAIAYIAGWTTSAVASAAYTITGTVAPPTFSVAAGAYTTAQTVALSTTTPGASIRYTTDGTTPTSTTGTLYSAAINIAAPATIKAIAYLSGWADSAVATAAYTITGTVATPTFTPAAGTYTSQQSVTIATTTPGASIRYTTDGSTPTSASGLLYSGPVAVNASMILKAIAYETGWADSTVASAPYTLNLTVSTPTFTPGAGTYTASQTVTIATATGGASIRYTTDGSTPSSTVGTLYTAPVTVNTSATLKSIAYQTGWSDSAVTSASYTLAVSAPSSSPAAGTYTSAQTVTLSTPTPGASIRYTTDGSVPTSTAGAIYTGPIVVGATATVRAIAYQSGWTDSPVTSTTYTITGTVAAPTFGVPAGTYTTPQTVSLNSVTPGASIRYTTDGSTPTETVGTLYTAPIAVNATATIKAIAYETSWTTSAVATAAYTITGTVATPAFSVPAGTYTTVQSVALSTTTPGATIRYTTDGTAPTPATGNAYTAPIAVTSTTTLRAIAYLSGWNDSAMASAFYTLNLPPADFTMTLASGPAPWLAGMSGTFTFTLASSSTFNDTVTFTSAQAPGGSTISFNPSSIALAPSASATVTVTVATRQTENGGVAGYFNPIVTASATSAAHSLTVPITLQDFGVTVGKQQQNLSLSNTGGPLNVEYAVQGVNGFDPAGVTLMWKGYYVNPGDSDWSASSIGSPGVLGYDSAGTPVLHMDISAIPPSIPERRWARIIGYSGTVVHYAQVEIDVNIPGAPDFTVGVTPPSQSLTQPGFVRYPIVINSGFNYSGQVSVSVAGVPAGISSEVDRTDGTPQTSYSISGGFPQQMFLKLTTTTSSPNGTWPLTVTVTDGTITKTASLSVTAGTSVTQSHAIATSQPGLRVTVDGTDYISEQTLEWQSGTSHTISAPGTQTDAAGTTYDWTAWSDGGGRQHVIVAGSSSTRVTANFVARIPDCQLGGPMPAAVTIGRGGWGAKTIVNIYSLNGYSGTCNLWPGSLPTGVTMNVDRNGTTTPNVTISQPCVVSVGSGAWVTITFIASTASVLGGYSIPLKLGDGNGPNHNQTISAQVTNCSSLPCGCFNASWGLNITDASGDTYGYFDVWNSGVDASVVNYLALQTDWARITVPRGPGNGYGETTRISATPVAGNNVHSVLNLPGTGTFRLADKGFGPYGVSAVIHATSTTGACGSFDYVASVSPVIVPRITSLSQSSAFPGQTLTGVVVSGDWLKLPSGGTAVTGARMVQSDGVTPVAGTTVTYTGMSGSSALINIALGGNVLPGTYQLGLTVLGQEVRAPFTV